MDKSKDFDAVVVGTGFAGAVTACRLVQAGLRICVLERGRRYGKGDFPVYPKDSLGEFDIDGHSSTPSLDFSRWRWKADQGLWDVRDLDEAIAVQAAGYGGGSLVYANVHLRAPDDIFTGWPKEYGRGEKKLDPYYDLAAYMLDVQPLPDSLPLAKTVQLQRAAHVLGHGAQWFRPPLAVNFGQPNRFGREQNACDLRGECWRGCTLHAKNTLDLNYLAVAEDTRSREDHPLADIRTLAEVLSIKSAGTSEQPLYEVTYYDHLTEKKEGPIKAPHVFLCAGAVNTTELLLRNADRLPGINTRWLGKRYHLNADSLAAVFDCDQAHQAEIGPTITGSILYNTMTPEDHNREQSDLAEQSAWFLIQDGGFPADMEPLLGIFRSPLWMRRNRFLESPETRSRQQGHYARLPPGLARGIVSGVSNNFLGARGRVARDTATDDWHIETARHTWVSTGQDQQAPERPDPTGPNPWPVLPYWLTKALEDDRDQLLDYVGWLAEPMITRLLDQVDDRLQREVNVAQMLASFGISDFDPGDIRKLSRGLLRLATQIVWGSESDMARHAARVLLEQIIPTDARDFVRKVSNLLVWALDYRAGDGYTGLLLTMGRDQVSYQLELDNKQQVSATDPLGNIRPRLSARYENKKGEIPQTAVRTMQERLMRDIAGAWEGELRTEPMWPFLRRRVTVHSQGGCPMSANRSHGVTDRHGEVFGCRGLYVMDAAAFPKPVGVNPSATIAAIAEYKVERFIRTLKKDKEWRAPQMEDARTWAANRMEGLDPIANITRSDPHPHNPIGIEFNEWMTGYHSEATDEILENARNRLTKSNLRGGTRQLIAYFRRADLEEAATITAIETRLHATISDLGAFLESDSRRAELSGTVSIAGLAENVSGLADELGPIDFEVGEGSRLLMFHHQGSGDDGSSGIATFDYLLNLEINGDPYYIRGIKSISDEPGLDLWQDTTTLYFGLYKGRADPEQDRAVTTIRAQEKIGLTRPVRIGILRVTADTFFNKQLASIEVTNTTDPARKSWALGAFVKYFFGNLLDIYVPEIGRVQDVIKNVMKQTHV